MLNSAGNGLMATGVAKGPKVAFVGSSLTSQSYDSGTGNDIYTNRGLYSFVVSELGHRFDVIHAGISGQHTKEIRRRIDDVLAELPDVVVVQAGTNDIKNYELDYIQADLEPMYDTIQKSGAILVVCTTPHRDVSASDWSVAENQKASQLNAWKMEYVRTNPGTFLADLNKYWVDPTSSDGNPYSGYSNDGTHFTPTGAYYVGLPVKEVLESLYPVSRDVLWTSPFVNTGELVNGPVNANPALVGTSGTTNTGTSGDVATNWRTYRNSGSNVTLTASKSTIAAPDNRVLQKLLFTTDEANSNVDTFIFYTNPSSDTIVAGGIYDVTCGVRTGAWAGFREIKLEFRDQAASGTVVMGAGKSIVAENLPAVARDEVLRGPIYTALSDSATIRIQIQVDNSVASDANAYIELYNFAARRIG